MFIYEYRTRLQEAGTFVMEPTKEYKIDGRRQYNNPTLVADLVANGIGLRYAAEEHLYVICVDHQKHVIGLFEVASGAADYVAFPLRDICKKSLMLNAHSVFIAHNHPAGTLTPSREDIDMTKKVATAMETIGIQLIDHLIIPGVTGGTFGYFSFREESLL